MARNLILKGLLVALSLAVVCGCSAPPSPEERAQTKELADLQSLKKTYSGVVMGFDIHGPSVDVSIDLQSMMSMDEDEEWQMVRDALTTWRKAWTSAHPHAHAMLVVRIIDFRGNQEFKEATRV